ncbi:hypothetical protein M426DRAFT_319159 [Hypoxylon sp. CI-4A]|nr:hypothetical protein M426DRAFT_319159 [Hypoxylon sp. CI-4A]
MRMAVGFIVPTKERKEASYRLLNLSLTVLLHLGTALRKMRHTNGLGNLEANGQAMDINNGSTQVLLANSEAKIGDIRRVIRSSPKYQGI